MHFRKYTISGLIIGLSLGGCAKGGNDNNAALAFLLAGGGSKNDGSASAKSLVTGASAAPSAVSSGVTAAASAPGADLQTLLSPGRVHPKVKDALLAFAKRQRSIVAVRVGSYPTAIPTAFHCTDGTCDGSSGETLSGTQNCAYGGTITANNVGWANTGTWTDKGSGRTVYNWNMTMNGPFTFANCATQSLDVSKLPGIVFTFVTLNGSVTLNGGSTAAGDNTSTCNTVGNIMTCNSTISATNAVNETASSSSLSVNGQNGSFTLTDASNSTITGTSSYTYDTVTWSMTSYTASITLTGNVIVSGTTSAGPVNINLPVSGSITCDMTTCH